LFNFQSRIAQGIFVGKNDSYDWIYKEIKMPEKQKTNNWTKAQTMIASGAMLGLLALFNVIASLDREKVDDKPGSAVYLPSIPTSQKMYDRSSLTPVSPKSVTRTRSS
jgi:hypothetical protein